MEKTRRGLYVKVAAILERQRDGAAVFCVTFTFLNQFILFLSKCLWST